MSADLQKPISRFSYAKQNKMENKIDETLNEIEIMRHSGGEVINLFEMYAHTIQKYGRRYEGNGTGNT